MGKLGEGKIGFSRNGFLISVIQVALRMFNLNLVFIQIIVCFFMFLKKMNRGKKNVLLD